MEGPEQAKVQRQFTLCESKGLEARIRSWTPFWPQGLRVEMPLPPAGSSLGGVPLLRDKGQKSCFMSSHQPGPFTGILPQGHRKMGLLWAPFSLLLLLLGNPGRQRTQLPQLPR